MIMLYSSFPVFSREPWDQLGRKVLAHICCSGCTYCNFAITIKICTEYKATKALAFQMMDLQMDGVVN